MALNSDRSEILRKIYFDPAGFMSMQRLYKEAKEKDKTITMNIVKEWYDNNIEKTRQGGRTNSFIAPHAKYEYQLDLFFINDLENQKFKIGLICIDIFSKFMTAVPLLSKQEADMAAGILEALNKMNGTPKFIYTDDEGSFSSNGVREILKEKKIEHIVTRKHAAFAERGIRTLKRLMYQRIDYDIKQGKKNIQWHEYLFQVLLVYNNKNEHSSTGMKPVEAAKAENRIDVKAELESKGKHNRKYKPLEVGDMVRIYTKRQQGEKERVPLFSKRKYPIEKIEVKQGLKFYYVNGRQVMRNEIILA
jgi:hypothetical protein